MAYKTAKWTWFSSKKDCVLQNKATISNIWKSNTTWKNKTCGGRLTFHKRKSRSKDYKPSLYSVKRALSWIFTKDVGVEVFKTTFSKLDIEEPVTQLQGECLEKEKN